MSAFPIPLRVLLLAILCSVMPIACNSGSDPGLIDQPDGDAPDGDDPDGDDPDGDDPDGDDPDGDDPDGDDPDGDDTDGDDPDGDDPDGDDPDGDDPDGDDPDGDDPDGDYPDGDYPDGDDPDGDDPDGDDDLCADVDCFDHAVCDPDSGECVCEMGFENWTENSGCSPEVFSIEGSYEDDWGGVYVLAPDFLTQSGWGPTSYYQVHLRSMKEAVLIARNALHNVYNPAKWSRFEWTLFDDGAGEALWICQTSFDSETLEAALDMTPADPASPNVSGCGGFSWQKLTPIAAHLPLAGFWDDNGGMTHSIDQQSWVQTFAGPPDIVYAYTFSYFSNAEKRIVAQNNDDNPTDPEAYSLFHWTLHDAGDGPALWICQSVYDAVSEADALAQPAPDASDPASAGCGTFDFPWSPLTPASVDD